MIAALLAVALASSQFAMSDGQPRTQPTTCDALYYGLGRTKDVDSAYRCYGADGDFEMQIIMALDGDGVRRDPRLVDNLFAVWERKEPEYARSGKTAPLREALAALQEGRLDTRVAFCGDVDARQGRKAISIAAASRSSSTARSGPALARCRRTMVATLSFACQRHRRSGDARIQY